jgi:hypothetical protein
MMPGGGNEGETQMKVKVQITIEHEADNMPIVEEIGCLCRGDLVPEALGMTLNEGKSLLASIQKTMVTHQATEYVEQQRFCPHCGKKRYNKGQHEITYRSLFGELRISSPRLYTCSCQPKEKRSFSPLAERLPERTAPEFSYLQAKWAALMSYGLTVDLLEEVLPLHASTTTGGGAAPSRQHHNRFPAHPRSSGEAGDGTGRRTGDVY